MYFRIVGMKQQGFLTLLLFLFRKVKGAVYAFTHLAEQ
jgi:hypothetical protein